MSEPTTTPPPPEEAPPRRHPARDLGASYPLLAGLCAYTAASLLVGPERASPAFYEAAAQVIPVLLLTLAVESRLLGLKGLWSIPVDLQARKVDSLISEIKGEIDALETHLVALGATAKVLEMNDAEEEGAREFWVENVGGELSAMQESLREQRAHVAERGNEIHKLAATYRRPYRVGGVTRALYSIITVAILAAGELWGLWVLAESSEKTSSPNLVVGAIAFGLVAVSVAALRREASGE